jgi:hypothetical protein
MGLKTNAKRLLAEADWPFGYSSIKKVRGT